MKEKKVPTAYLFIRWLVRLFSPKYRIVGEELLPDGACVIIGNHCHMYGPIASELYTPGPHDTWCAGEMMNGKEVAAYAFQDFWSEKPAGIRWFYRILSHLIVPLSVLVFNSADTIAVYHDSRSLSTFRTSVARLEVGRRVVIFPEKYQPRNNIVYGFHERFVDLARMYYKKTGRILSFVPMYLAPFLSEIHYGSPVPFDPDAPIKEERRRICNVLADRITAMATALPEHLVVPYPNLPKKRYVKNVPLEVYASDETSG